MRELTSKWKTTCLSLGIRTPHRVGELPPATPPSLLQRTRLMPTYPHSFRRHGQIVQKLLDLASPGRHHNRLINRHHHQHSFRGNRQSLLHLALSIHLPLLTALLPSLIFLPKPVGPRPALSSSSTSSVHIKARPSPGSREKLFFSPSQPFYRHGAISHFIPITRHHERRMYVPPRMLSPAFHPLPPSCLRPTPGHTYPHPPAWALNWGATQRATH